MDVSTTSRSADLRLAGKKFHYALLQTFVQHGAQLSAGRNFAVSDLPLNFHPTAIRASAVLT
ncbi:hypothetical protein, partial [Brucella intermedia]|uniref:hypothetical protein n=1 Tax=Brucella intermedia TaxID=94625 RepID=UPI00224A5E2F